MLIGNMTYDGPEDIPTVIPLCPLTAVLLLPRGQLPLNIFEPRYVDLIDASLKGGRMIGIVQPNPEQKETDSKDNPSLCSVGCVGRITTFQESGDGRYLVTLTGITRFRILDEVLSDNKFRMARISAGEFHGDFHSEVENEQVNRKLLLETLRKYLDAKELGADWENVTSVSTEALVNALAMMSPFGAQEKQALLEAPTLAERADILVAITEMELAKSGNNGGNTLQ